MGVKFALGDCVKWTLGRGMLLVNYPAFTSLRIVGVVCAVGLAKTLFCLTNAGVLMDSSEMTEKKHNAKVNATFPSYGMVLFNNWVEVTH